MGGIFWELEVFPFADKGNLNPIQMPWRFPDESSSWSRVEVAQVIGDIGIDFFNQWDKHHFFMVFMAASHENQQNEAKRAD